MTDEIQIHNIDIHRENLSSHDTGGAFRVVNVDVTVDSSVSLNLQRVALIHEILGAYLGSFVSRSNLEEISEAINDGLNQLKRR